MTTERWKQIEEVYHAALELTHSDRSAYLDQACAADEDLRHEVESLLASQDKAQSFLESSPDDVVAGMMIAETGARSMIGRTLGRYQLHSLIGTGGMGEVYRASDTGLDREVAVKILPEHLAHDHQALRRFQREAKAVASLSHPNILSIFDFGTEAGVSYAVMELLEGETLRSHLERGPLTWRKALEIGIAIADGLDTAHAKGIIHRDLKPENIFLTHSGGVKILDFGIARVKRTVPPGSAPTRHTTQQGAMMGTVGYMSPEQVRGEAAEAPSDIFSLGCVLYEMASGQMPFERKTRAKIIAAILTEDAPALSDKGKGSFSHEIPAEFERVVNKALQKECEARYQKATDLLIDLKNLKLESDVEPKREPVGTTKVRHDVTLSNQPRATSSFDPRVTSVESPESPREKLEPVGGAVPLESEFYMERPTDEEFRSAIARRDSIVLVKGARQVGKTSLLARGLNRAREAGAKVVLTDFQKLTAAYLESAEKLLLTLAESFADQLDLDTFPSEMWNPKLSPGINFERYLRRVVFARFPGPIVWGLDEVDRLFTCAFGSEVFGLFRSWHNERALDPQGQWHRLTLAISYATEAHLFITDLNQSPFNVGTRLVLGDFTFEQVAELNRRHGLPLRDNAEVARFFRLVGGHPYLVRGGLHEMVSHGLKLADLEAQADHEEGPFSDHLRRFLVSLTQDAALSEVVREVLRGGNCPTSESFYRLRSAGLLTGDSPRDARPRCQLYATYLERHLL